MLDEHYNEAMLKKGQCREKLNFGKATLSLAKVLGEVFENRLMIAIVEFMPALGLVTALRHHERPRFDF